MYIYIYIDIYTYIYICRSIKRQVRRMHSVLILILSGLLTVKCLERPGWKSVVAGDREQATAPVDLALLPAHLRLAPHRGRAKQCPACPKHVDLNPQGCKDLWQPTEALSLTHIPNSRPSTLDPKPKTQNPLSLDPKPPKLQDLDRATDLQQFFRSSSAMLASLSVRNLPLVIIRQQGLV